VQYDHIDYAIANSVWSTEYIENHKKIEKVDVCYKTNPWTKRILIAYSV